MKKQELNRDVKRLWRYYNDFNQNDPHNANKADHIEREFVRLYYADDTFEYMNKQSILIMMRLNHLYRLVPIHQFGINVKI